jgi:hypothetical protein
MNHWTRNGAFSVHVIRKKNELAGYCSVLHALQLVGITGVYGRRLRAAVTSFGATRAARWVDQGDLTPLSPGLVGPVAVHDSPVAPSQAGLTPSGTVRCRACTHALVADSTTTEDLAPRVAPISD